MKMKKKREKGKKKLWLIKIKSRKSTKKRGMKLTFFDDEKKKKKKKDSNNF